VHHPDATQGTEKNAEERDVNERDRGFLSNVVCVTDNAITGSD
jgi:hypothetical protein